MVLPSASTSETIAARSPAPCHNPYAMADQSHPDPAIDPVLCSPYDPPDRHWNLDSRGRADREQLPAQGRRDPLHISVPSDAKATAQQAMTLNDRKSNPTVMAVRAAVDKWRRHKYAGATAVSRRLLQHWTDDQSMLLRPFFAQVEAIETFIWLREVATRGTTERRDVEAEARRLNDGIVRLCAKMATGTGKTAVMGMLIAWQTLNAERSRRTRNLQHTNRFVVLAPGHTVRERLSVLMPSADENVYDEMGLVPKDLRRRLNQARVKIINYQAFTQKELISDSDARKLLGKARNEDVESWDAAVRRVLGDIADGTGQVCVINDEAHHCYLPQETGRSKKKEDKDEDARAAVWFNAIRAMRDGGVLGPVDHNGQAFPVYDFSATPLWIDTSRKSEPEQFQWVVSDFGLMEAIESGLVKVPRVPIDDDSNRDETIWRKLYDNTNPKKLADYLSSADGSKRLPDHLHGAVQAVVNDWVRKLQVWQGHPRNGDGQIQPPQPTPPVIIFVANNISNATALWEYLSGSVDEDGTVTPGAFPELANLDETGHWHTEPRTLLVHSKVGGSDAIPKPLKKMLARAAGYDKETDAEAAVREMLNTVGKPGRAGAQVRCVVSVSMLTEGWDARTVTHIVGFRAFGTQLLCEQVTGRALRRTSYDAFREPDSDGRQRLEAEYADVVGIPFEFMPDVSQPEPVPRPPKPRTRVHTLEGKRDLRVAWPQVVDYQHFAPQGTFDLDPDKVTGWRPSPTGAASIAALEGVAGEGQVIGSVAEGARQRTALLELAAEVTAQIVSLGETSSFGGKDVQMGRASLYRCALKASQRWASHHAVDLDDLRRLGDSTTRRKEAAASILSACDFGGTEPVRRARLANPPILDTDRIDFETTLGNIAETRKSELSHAACHSRLELKTAEVLDDHPQVLRWVRNFQLGWAIPYWKDGAWARYEPDFVAVLEDGTNLVIECKGAWDDKALEAARYVKEHWIPSIAGTTDLPDDLRRWGYAVIDDPNSIRYQLDLAIKATP